jgi:hypothetical protein
VRQRGEFDLGTWMLQILKNLLPKSNFTCHKRITVEIILKKLSQNISFDEILSDYPRLKREDIQAAIAYAVGTP